MRLSTIIPAYNRADLIGETLRAVLSQTRPPDEVIVVDDGSTDGTPDVVAAFGKAVTLLRQENAGAGPARNLGLAKSIGQVVSFMDSDDIPSLNFYEAGLAATNAGADMTYSPWLKARFCDNRLVPEPWVIQQRPVPGKVPLDVLALLVDWVTVFQACMFDRNVLERAGPYRSDLKPSEDTELLYRVCREVRAPRHLSNALLLYRVHPENQVSEQHLGKRLLDRAHLWSVLQEHLERRGDLSPSVRRRFRRKKYDVARDASEYDASRAELLATDVSSAERASAPFRHFARRVAARSRVALSGDPYPRVFAAGPLTFGQRYEIGRLGYCLQE